MLAPDVVDLHALLDEFAGLDAVGVAHGLISLRPTAHLATLGNGTRVYTWCALDTLIVAHLLECDLEATSRSPYPDPATGPVLTMSLHDGRLTADPSYVLSFPQALDESGRHFTQAFCPYANLFADDQAYARWAPLQPRVTAPITVARADEIARAYATDVRARAAAGRCCSAA